MLARGIPQVPTGPGMTYEPKWDGFRSIAFRDRDEVELASRGGKTLTRYFSGGGRAGPQPAPAAVRSRLRTGGDPARQRRWRPDREPGSCDYHQLERPVMFDVDQVLAGNQ